MSKNRSRKNRSRKNRSRKNRSRKNRRSGGGLFQKVLYGPVHQALGMVGNTVSTVTNTTRNIARKGISGVNRIGKSITNRANSAVRGVLSRKMRRDRR
jgi:hypothetical protein